MKLNRFFARVLQNKFSKSALIYTISTFCNSLVPFLILPVLTRYLSTEEYGIISMFNATVSFIVPFVSMGFSTAIQRKLVEGRTSTDGEYLFNGYMTIIVSELIVAGGIYIFRVFFEGITGIPGFFLIDVILLCASTAITDAVLAVLQIKERPGMFGILQNSATFLNVISSLVMIVGLGMSLKGRIYSITFSKLAFAVIGMVVLQKEISISPKFNTAYIKDIVLNFGIPMIPASIKSTVLTCTDRIFITNMESISETGVYSVGNQFAMPILILAQAFNLAFVPHLFSVLKEDDRYAKTRIVKFTYAYFFAIVFVSIAWTLFSKSILALIVGEEYHDAVQYIFWLSMGYAFTGMHMMVVNYIYYLKQVRIYAFITIVVIIINIILNYFMITSYGSVGAAQATMIANFISFILTWILTIKICDMPWRLNWNRKE